MPVYRDKKRDNIKYFLLILISCILITLTACGGGDGTSNPPQPPQEPSVTSVNPAAFATEVGMDTQVQATFNVAMDPDTINTSTFMLSSPSGVDVIGTVSYDTVTNTANFDPSYDLAPLTTYTATISGVRDTAGTSMSSPYSWSFVTVTGFWAYDFDIDITYFAPASFVGEGDHCLIYLEENQLVDPNAINEIVNQFDNAIYTNEILAFGEEPNPGIDGNSKIFIFLLDIRDGYTPALGSYIAGYFNPLDEYNISDINLHSNQKELFNMDIYPAVPGDQEFLRTLAHEFQHMISWNQKTNLRGVYEDTWLEEALSEIAPLFCSYGPDYSRVIGYQLLPWDSLTHWSFDVFDYSSVYMWSQYMYDQVTSTDSSGHNVFWNITHTENTGIDAVNTGLNAVGYLKDFSDVFRDWSMANYLGLTAIPEYPEWSYATIHTEEGFRPEGFDDPLPGLPIDDGLHLNASVVGGLHLWGLDYFEFTKTGDGTVTWSRTDPTDEAAFIDMNTHTVKFNMESGTAYPYTNSGILITRNPTDFEKPSLNGGGTMTFTSVRAKDTLMSPYLSKRPYLNEKSSALLTPKTLMLQVSSDPLTKALSEKTGRPVSVCVDHFFREREKSLRKELLKNN
jgi:hypothetical protein